MGQYYQAVTADNLGRIMRYDPKVDGESCGFKLMEHSYIGNEFCDTIAEEIYNDPDGKRLAWIGDYAEEDGLDDKEKKKLFRYIRDNLKGEEIGSLESPEKEFCMMDKILWNLDSGEFINCNVYREMTDEYYKEEKEKEDFNYGYINPMSVLTAVGNGLGGGDYHGSCMKHVGQWAFDRIKIVDIEEIDEVVLSGAKELRFIFIEGEEED